MLDKCYTHSLLLLEGSFQCLITQKHQASMTGSSRCFIKWTVANRKVAETVFTHSTSTGITLSSAKSQMYQAHGSFKLTICTEIVRRANGGCQNVLLRYLGSIIMRLMSPLLGFTGIVHSKRSIVPLVRPQANSIKVSAGMDLICVNERLAYCLMPSCRNQSEVAVALN